jgi:iduronate 2-sulfatase
MVYFNTRTKLLLSLLATSAIGVSLCGWATNAQSEKPNVLFIAADDLRMNLGCYGDEIAVTPNLDKLAEQSVIFDRAYCQFPSCNASRASILTGMRPDFLSVWHLEDNFRKTAPNVVTLPQYLKEQGYHTESTGKILHNYNKIRDNEKSWSVPARFDQENHFLDYAFPKNSRKGQSKGLIAENADVEDDAYVDGRITQDAVSAIRRLAGKNQPFFLAVGFLKPHSPYNAPSKYWDLYKRDDMSPLGPESRPQGAAEYNWFNYSEIRTFPEFPAEGPPSEELARRLRHGYYAATSFVDSNVGQLLDALQEAGIAESTIIVFWSDHGYHLGENSHWSKVMARDLDGHVPLLVSVPDKKASRSKAIVEYIDIYPTLVDLCDLPSFEGIDGKSFAHVVNNPSLEAREAALTQVCRPWPKGPIEQMGYSLRTKKFRYTQWIDFTSGKILAEELYDHASDPFERNNLINDTAYQSNITYLRDLMTRNRT